MGKPGRGYTSKAGLAHAVNVAAGGHGPGITIYLVDQEQWVPAHLALRRRYSLPNLIRMLRSATGIDAATTNRSTSEELVQRAQREPGARSRPLVLLEPVKLVHHDHRDQHMDILAPPIHKLPKVDRFKLLRVFYVHGGVQHHEDGIQAPPPDSFLKRLDSYVEGAHALVQLGRQQAVDRGERHIWTEPANQ